MEQNLTLCLLFSALGGLFSTLASVILVAEVGRKEEKEKKKEEEEAEDPERQQQNADDAAQEDTAALTTTTEAWKGQHDDDEEEERCHNNGAAAAAVVVNRSGGGGGGKKVRLRTALLYAANLVLQAASNTSYTFAPMYGPVSLYRPTATSSRLLFNMLLIGGLLGRENGLRKQIHVGTIQCVVAVVVLPVVGPAVQDYGGDENNGVMGLLQKPGSIAWLGMLSAMFFVSTIYMSIVNLKKKRQLTVQVCVWSSGVSAAVLTGTVAKAMGSIERLTAPWSLFVAYYVVLQLGWVIQQIKQAIAVTSLTSFVPMYSVGSLTLNAATGLIVWEDWKAIPSPIGYAAIFTALLLCVYQLSDLDFTPNKGNSRNNNNNRSGGGGTANGYNNNNGSLVRRYLTGGDGNGGGGGGDLPVDDDDHDDDHDDSGKSCTSSRSLRVQSEGGHRYTSKRLPQSRASSRLRRRRCGSPEEGGGGSGDLLGTLHSHQSDETMSDPSSSSDGEEEEGNLPHRNLLGD